jgi:hypothetical protein
MSGPNPKRQKEGWATLDKLFGDASNVWVIHYSCESFYDRPEGRSPRVTSIAVRRLDSGQTLSFSIHQVAEEQKIGFNEIEAQYDKLVDRFQETNRFKVAGPHPAQRLRRCREEHRASDASRRMAAGDGRASCHPSRRPASLRFAGLLRMRSGEDADMIQTSKTRYYSAFRSYWITQ